MATQAMIPWELKYDFALKGWADTIKGVLYTIRKKYGATAALKMYEKLCKRDDRVKNMTNTIKDVFKLEGNDAETIGKWFDIWGELNRYEYTWLERSKTNSRTKISKCLFKTEPKDISDWTSISQNIITKTINPNATFERPKAMCAGDPYCEYVWKLEESTQLIGEEEPMAKKLAIPMELKYDFAMRGWIDTMKGFLYAIREDYGATAALEIFEMFYKEGDRVKNVTKTLLNIFKIPGNDAETIASWFTIFLGLTGIEGTWPEVSKTRSRYIITKCPFRLAYKDLSGWSLIFKNIIAKTINPKATVECLRGTCAGEDPPCEYVFNIEE